MNLDVAPIYEKLFSTFDSQGTAIPTVISVESIWIYGIKFHCTSTNVFNTKVYEGDSTTLIADIVLRRDIPFEWTAPFLAKNGLSIFVAGGANVTVFYSHGGM